MILENTLNINRVLRTIWEQRQISRTEIAHHLAVNRSTITKITTPLLEEGILVMEEKGESSPNGGRKPIDLSLNRRLGIIIGIEIQTERWNMVATDLYGDVLMTGTFELEFDAREVTRVLLGILRTAEKETRSLGIPVIGAGIGISGLVNPYTGRIFQSNPMRIYQSEDLYPMLSRGLPYPVIVENDANCCCYSELIRKKAYRERNFLSVLGEFRKSRSGEVSDAGIAIGTGIVIKGSVLHGDTFSAGEFQSVFKGMTNDSQFNLNPDELKRIHRDDALIRGVMRELSKNLALLVNMMNFTLINFEGDIVRYEGILREMLETEIQTNWSYDSDVQCQMYFGDPESNSVAHGAAGVVIEKMFSPPLLPEPTDYYPSGIDFLRYRSSRSPAPDLSAYPIPEE